MKGEQRYGKDLRAVELADGRTCLDDTAEKTQNDKEKEEDLNPVRNFAFRPFRRESATYNGAKRPVAMLGNHDVEVTIHRWIHIRSVFLLY